MAKKSDLMGLGMPVFLARRLAMEPLQVTAVGASRASATTLPGEPYLVCVVGSSTGMSVELPAVGGDTGALLGDPIIVHALYATVSVYPGSGATISTIGANYATATGVTVEANTATVFYPITVSQWVGVKGS